MSGANFSVILLPTSQCNADCSYCFENKTRERMTLDQLDGIIRNIFDYMETRGATALTLHWQGGEAMLLPPEWYEQARERTEKIAADRNKQVFHGLQTNMLLYRPAWNPVIRNMFGNSVSTSVDYPNLHRKIAGHGPETYNEIWFRKVRMAREAGIDVKVICVANQGTLDVGADRFYRYMVDELGVTDFQVNTPFPGGDANADTEGLPLPLAPMIEFYTELADIWLERGLFNGVRIGPFDELMNVFSHEPSCLPCIWTDNCADHILAIDARGNVAQCDCWVTSYPEQLYGNLFESGDLAALLSASRVRQDFQQRPVSLVQRDCIECDYLSLCHGGCPVRTYTVKKTLFDKDPYCSFYKALFAHMESSAARVAGKALPSAGDPASLQQQPV